MKRFDNATAAEQNVAAREVKPGTYVRKVNKDGTPQNKVYSMGAYCRTQRRYMLDDVEDSSREVPVKPDSLLFVGFDY